MIPLQRLDPGDIATSQSRDEEVSNVDETMDVQQLNNSFLSLRDEDSDEIASILAASEVRDWKNIGCGCKMSYCYTNLDFDQLECLALMTVLVTGNCVGGSHH